MRQNIPIQKILLTLVAVPGVIALSAIAPGIGPVFRMFGFSEKRHYSEKYIHNTLYRMKAKGLVRFEEKSGTRCVVLTKKGKDTLAAQRTRGYEFKKPKKWDGKWRIVIFDIKEKRRNVRDHLRFELQSIGFIKLQQSVWIFPYECEEFIKLLKSDYRIGKDIVYLVAEKVEYDTDVKMLFNL